MHEGIERYSNFPGNIVRVRHQHVVDPDHVFETGPVLASGLSIALPSPSTISPRHRPHKNMVGFTAIYANVAGNGNDALDQQGINSDITTIARFITHLSLAKQYRSRLPAARLMYVQHLTMPI